MKDIKFKYFVGIFAMLAMMLVVGCSKDDEDEQGPTVSIESMDPGAVIQGETFRLKGQNLNTVLHIFIGTEEAPFVEDGNDLIVTVPATADPGEATITLAMINNYRVTSTLEVVATPIPIVTAFDAFVPIGGDLVFEGLNLDNNTSVMIDGVSATITSNTGNEMIVTVPDGIPDNLPLEIEIMTSFGELDIPTPFIARENLLVNGQLEDGEGDDFAGWEKLNGGDGMTSVIGEDAFGGGRSMRVVGAASNPWNTQFASTPVELEFEGQYTILFWAKAEAEGAIMRVSQSQWDGNGADYFYGPDVMLETEWKAYSFPLTVGKDLPTHRSVFDMGHTDIPFLIDHLALVPGTIDFSGVTGEKPEILTNSGFEEGMTGWEILNGAFETTMAEAYCGSSSLTATGVGGNPWDVQIAVAADGAPVLSVGTMYELGFWLKAAGPDGVMRASVSRWDGNGDDFFYTPDVTATEEWAYHSFVFEAAATNSGVHQVVLDFGSTTQTFFIDEVSVKEYEPTSIIDGSFENGMDGWEILNGDFFTATMDEAYAGSSSLTATGVGGNPWDVQIALAEGVAPTLEPGTMYKMSFWAKAAGPDGVMRASVSRWDGNGDDFFYSPDITVAEDWTLYSFVFEAQATNSGIHQIVLDFGATTQTFFVDNVLLYEANIGCE